MRALILMVSNPAGLVRNFYMKNAQKREERRQEGKNPDSPGRDGIGKREASAKGERKGWEMKDGRF